jgi:cell division protein FtsI/penicillin-binding protein 2
MNKKKFPDHLSLRLNLLFLITFILFASLIFRLGFVQIVKGEEYLQDTETNNVRRISVEAPRGWILDRNGHVMVTNEVGHTLTYTRQFNTSAQYDQIAQRIAELIEADEAAILRGLQRSALYVPERIKQNLSKEEMFRVAEHLHELPGIGIMEDPIRDYRYGGLFSQFLGRVGHMQSEDVQRFLAQGYRLNEWVGTSYLEKQYELQLRGQEGRIEVYVDKQQRPIGDPVYFPGQRGNDLILTIDIELQAAIERIIAQTIADYDLVTNAFFVAMDPFTGEILGMSNDVRTIGAGGNSYAAGSTVKMATVLMGLHEGLVTPSTIIVDQPMQIGDQVKRSWRNLGRVNVYDAIQRSSNVYMFNIGMKLANYTGTGFYRREAFDEAIYYFSQFGLGVKTGIDLPEGTETAGYKSNDRRLGLLADFMIGQYHNYTPLQLTQYVSTIANGGYRVQPYLVREIRKGVPIEGQFGQVVFKKEPTILNQIDMSAEHLSIVQRAMEMVTEPNGTAYRIFQDFPYKVAAKTGTAQTVNPGGTRGLNNTLLVGYAPVDNPKIAFATVVPQSQESQSQNQIAHAQVITRQILEVFFGLDKNEEIEAELEAPEDALN